MKGEASIHFTKHEEEESLNTESQAAESIQEEDAEGDSKGKESQSEEWSREGYKGAESIKLATGRRKVSETELPKVPEPAPQQIIEK